MRGTKRLGVSDSAPDSSTNNNSSFSKNMMMGPQFGIQREGFSQPKLMGSSLLDMQRAELSRQHVRALNNQFASWVQTQLQNHPDELWEDGVRDYLTHASSIMDKFSDVVNWLESNSTKSENLLENVAPKKVVTESKDNANVSFQAKPLSAFPPSGTTPIFSTSGFTSSWSSGPLAKGESLLEQGQKKVLTESKDNANVSFQAKPLSASLPSGTTPIFSTSGFTSSWSSGPLANSETLSEQGQKKVVTESKDSAKVSFQESVFSVPSSGTTSMFSTSSSTSSWSTGPMFNTQSSFSFGGQSSLSVKTDAPKDADGEDDDVKKPSSPSLKKIEESGISVVHEVKCKLYVKSTDPEDKDAWKDRGTGQLSIKCKEGVTKGTKDSKPTILIRNDVGRLLLNALIYPGIKTNLQKNSIVAIFHTADDNGSENSNVVARTFLIRTKSQEDRDKLAAAIKEYAPAA